MIVKTPRGEAPEWVRKAWLLVKLPCIGKFPPHLTSGVLTGDFADEEHATWDVPQAEAIEILALTQPEAAQWWYANGFPKKGTLFAFWEDEAVPLPGGDNRDAWG